MAEEVEQAHGGEHEIWVWLADEFLKVNEELKTHLNADVIALAQLVQGTVKGVQQIRLLGILGRAYVKVGKNGKKYLIFKGARAGERPILQGTRYARGNPLVRCFVVGNKEIIEDAAKATKIAVIAAGAGAAIGVALVSIAGVPTVVAFCIVVAVGFGVGWFLTDLDQKYKLTEMARARMMAYERGLIEQLSATNQKIKDIGQAVDKGKRAVQDAIEIYYAVDRIWRTIEEYIRTGLSPLPR